MDLAIVLVVAALVLGVILGLKQREKMNQHIADGRMIKRDIRFIETEELFTLSGGDFQRVVSEIQATSFAGTGVSIQKNDAKQAIQFQGSGWAAQLWRQADSGENAVYAFCFTRWKTHRGIPLNHMEMNMLLTAVEKMFLRIDPNTQVQTRALTTKTRPSFF